MRVFIKPLKSIVGISRKVLLFGLLGTTTLLHLSGQQQPPTGVKFEVVSVRVLSEKEAADRSLDFIGPNVAVRLRLSCSDRGFYFYTWQDSVTPLGYTVRITEGGTVWLFGKSGQESVSPGINKTTFGFPGAWRLLSAHDRPAIEWEVLDSTRSSGEKHAFTIFIKLNEKDQPHEIVSQPFVVPAGPGPSK